MAISSSKPGTCLLLDGTLIVVSNGSFFYSSGLSLLSPGSFLSGNLLARQRTQFFQTSSFTCQSAQIVELLTTYTSMTYDFDLLDARRVDKECALDANTMCNSAHCKSSRFPSTTFTCRRTVSPDLISGISLRNSALSTASSSARPAGLVTTCLSAISYNLLMRIVLSP